MPLGTSLPTDTSYPRSTRFARLADDRAARELILWVYDLLLRVSPAQRERFARPLANVETARDALEAAHAECEAFVAPCDRARVRAEDEDAALMERVRELAAALCAEAGALPRAPFDVIPRESGSRAPPRDVVGVMARPHLELIFTCGDLVERLPAELRRGGIDAAAKRILARLPGAQQARLESVDLAIASEKALAARARCRAALIVAAEALEKEATASGDWESMAPGFRQLPLAAFYGLPEWFRRVADGRRIRRWIVSASLRRTLLMFVPLAAALLVLGECAHRTQPAAQVPQPVAQLPTPSGLGRYVMGEIVNLDGKVWKVASTCTGPSAKDDTGTMSPAGSVNSQKKLGLGYGENGQFSCSTTLEGGTSSCVLHGGDRCSIKDGKLYNDGSY